MEVLEHSKGFIRSSLAKKLDIRRCPELRFVHDDGYKKEERITELLNKDKKVAYSSHLLDLNKFPLLKKDQDLGSGIITYQIEDSYQGLLTIRQIATAQLKQNHNPWCLINQKDGCLDQAVYNWSKYSAYPKHVAFQNNRLIAFCAQRFEVLSNGQLSEGQKWWDLQDKQFDGINARGKIIFSREYKPYTIQQHSKIAKQVLWDGLRKNQKGQIITKGDILITNDMLVNGHLPFKFDRVQGTFDINNCTDLITLEGAPKYVGEQFKCMNCFGLREKQLQFKPTLVKKQEYSPYHLKWLKEG